MTDQIAELRRRIAEEDLPWSPARVSSDEVASLLDQLEADSRDREAVLALLKEAEELRALVRKMLRKVSEDYMLFREEAARLGCKETKG